MAIEILRLQHFTIDIIDGALAVEDIAAVIRQHSTLFDAGKVTQISGCDQAGKTLGLLQIKVIVEFGFALDPLTDRNRERSIEVLLQTVFTDITQRFFKSCLDACFIDQSQNLFLVDEVVAVLQREPG